MPDSPCASVLHARRRSLVAYFLACGFTPSDENLVVVRCITCFRLLPFNICSGCAVIITRKSRIVSWLALSALLAACATPRQQCISNATSEVRQVRNALLTAQENVARGYAIHKQSVPYTVQRICYRIDPATSASVPYPCPQTAYRIQTTPVAIDVAQERVKIAEYKRILPRLAATAETKVRQCEAAFPETG